MNEQERTQYYASEMHGSPLVELIAFRCTNQMMVWLKNKEDFPGFNSIYGEYFDHDPPARSAVVSDLLVDVLVEVEVVAYKPEL